MKGSSKIDFALLNVGKAHHFADWNYENVSSPFTRIYLVTEGEAGIFFPEGFFELTPNHLYIIPSFTPHTYKCTGLFKLNYIHVYEMPETNITEQYTFPFEVDASELDYLLVEKLLELNPRRELKHYDPEFYDNSATLLKNIAANTHQSTYVALRTKGILFCLFSKFLEKAKPKFDVKDHRIAKSLLYIRRNIHLPLSIDELSKMSFLSSDHYIRLFKKEMNCTPIQYINQKKIEHAQLLLSLKSESIKEVAYSLSFENISYFNRLFKKITGKTPKQYCNEINIHSR